MRILFLYIGTILIWGTTWLAITFQLGRVDPLVSVFYRFALASLLSIGLCRLRALPLKFRAREHGWIALQGFLMFSIGYWMVYAAERLITSGLAAVVTSSLIFMNILGGRLFLGKPFSGHVLSGAALGIAGIALIFMPELRTVSWTDRSFQGLVLCSASTVLYSLGNITSERNGKTGLPILQTNALSMGYGALFLLILILALGKHFTFEPSFKYIGSLSYLVLFGSIAAFWCYMTLIQEIGADRAAYGPLVVPVLALGLSAAFEAYHWSAWSLAGILLIAAGNLLVLGRGRAGMDRIGLKGGSKTSGRRLKTGITSGGPSRQDGPPGGDGFGGDGSSTGITLHENE
ncbi:EamA family transporter [bacterium]|nr:EamA family transporter [bacterium]